MNPRDDLPAGYQYLDMLHWFPVGLLALEFLGLPLLPTLKPRPWPFGHAPSDNGRCLHCDQAGTRRKRAYSHGPDYGGDD
jgi:hypothetical protein